MIHDSYIRLYVWIDWYVYNIINYISNIVYVMVCDFKFDSIISVLVFEEKNCNPYIIFMYTHTFVCTY